MSANSLLLSLLKDITLATRIKKPVGKKKHILAYSTRRGGKICQKSREFRKIKQAPAQAAERSSKRPVEYSILFALYTEEVIARKNERNTHKELCKCHPCRATTQDIRC